MANNVIYRSVSVRALLRFNDDKGGLSVNAERVWCRLLIDTSTTIVPGLVITTRGGLADRCRLTRTQFDDAFAELSGFRDKDGVADPMAIANWPQGVVILPGAPRQPQHRPHSTSIPVQWARFLNREAPKCEEVAQLREAWRAVFAELDVERAAEAQAKGKPAPAPFLEAFDAESRGKYKDRAPASVGGSPNESPKASVNRSPNVSPNNSPNLSAKASPNGSPSVSQESGIRNQEVKTAVASAGAPVARDYNLGALEADWWRLVECPPGDRVGLSALLEKLDEAAKAKGLSAFDVAERVLPAGKAIFAEMRERKVHHGTPSAVALATHPVSNPGLYFAQAFERAFPATSAAPTPKAPPRDPFAPNRDIEPRL